MLSYVKPISIDEDNNVWKVLPSSISSAVSIISSNDLKVQTKLFAHSPNPMAAAHLNVAIVDCIHSNYVPFRLTKDQKSVATIQAAKFPLSTYVTLTQAAIAGVLLNAT